jgi:hypothetical protein
MLDTVFGIRLKEKVILDHIMFNFDLKRLSKYALWLPNYIEITTFSDQEKSPLLLLD